MPKLQYRFRAIFENFGTTGDTREMTRQIMNITKPNLTFEQITLDAYNSRSYLAGKHTWEPVSITLREDASNNVQRVVGQQLQRQFDFFEQSSAVSGGTYKFQMRIETLDGGNGANGPTPIDRFQLVGCYLESVNYNNADYSVNDPMQITLNVRYDNAIQFGEGGDGDFVGVGVTTARATTESPGGETATG